VEVKNFVENKTGKDRAAAVELLKKIAVSSNVLGVETELDDELRKIIGDHAKECETDSAKKAIIYDKFWNSVVSDQVDERDEREFVFNDSDMCKSLSDPVWFFYSISSGITFFLDKGHF
jgi:hypothetical protein